MERTLGDRSFSGGNLQKALQRAENHLWLKYRKGLKLSGLVEPRISAVNGGECQKVAVLPLPHTCIFGNGGKI